MPLLSCRPLAVKRPAAPQQPASGSAKARGSGVVQMHLDLGQKGFGHQTCRECGMVYVPGRGRFWSDELESTARIFSATNTVGLS